MSTYHKIAWTLTLLVAIAGVLVGMVDFPVVVLVILSIITGFWWAFGHGFVDGGSRDDSGGPRA